MPYEITVTTDFSASHQLMLYDGSLEPLHGHNWHVRVTVSASALDAIGVVMDFHELHKLVREVVGPWHSRHLNDMPEFASRNPSAENVAAHIAETLKTQPAVTLEAVEVWETPDCRARWIRNH